MSVFTKIHYQDVREISLRSRKSQGRWKSKKWPPWTENLQNIETLYSWHSLIQTFKRNQSNVHIFSVDKCMFSIQICGYSDDWDYETGGESKIYYNKGFQRKPGSKAFDKKCAQFARIIDILQASSRIDLGHIKVNRFTSIYWSFSSFLSLLYQYGFLAIFKCCHWAIEKPGSTKFENIDA